MFAKIYCLPAADYVTRGDLLRHEKEERVRARQLKRGFSAYDLPIVKLAGPLPAWAL